MGRLSAHDLSNRMLAVVTRPGAERRHLAVSPSASGCPQCQRVYPRGDTRGYVPGVYLGVCTWGLRSFLLFPGGKRTQEQ